MHKNTVQVAFWTAVTAASIVVIMQTNRSYNQQLYARFPEFDRKIVRKAYKKLMNEALRGKLDLTDWSDDQFDEHFRYECYEMQFAN